MEKEILTLNWTILYIYEVLKRDSTLNDLQGDIPPVSDHLDGVHGTQGMDDHYRFVNLSWMMR